MVSEISQTKKKERSQTEKDIWVYVITYMFHEYKK